MATLYKRNNNGKPIFWGADIVDNKIRIAHGIVGKPESMIVDVFPSVQKDIHKEVESKYNQKIKTGYITLDEVVDEVGNPPVEEKALAEWLAVNLPRDLSNGNNDTLLPMLAKAYSGSFWKYSPVAMCQYKINGLRCIIRAVPTNDLFHKYHLTFQSREGIYWNTLAILEEYLLNTLSEELLGFLVESGAALDGEIYLPGFSINDINHFVKDATDPHNAILQYWCYDVLVEDYTAHERYVSILSKYMYKFNKMFANKSDHLNNTNRLILLPTFMINTDFDLTDKRNQFINLGFEGIILRNPDSEYQFGRRRVGYMEKFKAASEGTFVIVDIYPENKRKLPIIKCKNDINDAEFETRLSLPHDAQQRILEHKDSFIGKVLHIEFGERSGIEKVPFHIKRVSFNNDNNFK